MGLTNPLLGVIPQPKDNSREIALSPLPKSNYGAQVITPQLNEPRIFTLEGDTTVINSFSDSKTTTESFVLTGIILNRSFKTTVNDSTCLIDVRINGVNIFSFNEQYDITSTNQSLFIPIDYYLYPPNSKFELIGSTNHSIIFANISFIGYTNPKL